MAVPPSTSNRGARKEGEQLLRLPKVPIAGEGFEDPGGVLEPLFLQRPLPPCFPSLSAFGLSSFEEEFQWGDNAQFPPLSEDLGLMSVVMDLVIILGPDESGVRIDMVRVFSSFPNSRSEAWASALEQVALGLGVGLGSLGPLAHGRGAELAGRGFQHAWEQRPLCIQ